MRCATSDLQLVIPAIYLSIQIARKLMVVHCTFGVKVNCTIDRVYCAKNQNRRQKRAPDGSC